MTDYHADIDRLMSEAAGLGHGPAQVAVVEEAVRLADTHGDIRTGFDTRLDLMDAATFGGRPDLLLVAFSWCLAHHDRDPALFPAQRLLWKYKWVVNNVVEFPQISRVQIDEMLADMARRFTAADATQHAYYQQKEGALRRMGDRQAADEAAAQLVRTQRDWLSDCRACEVDGVIEDLVTDRRDEEALAKAATLLAGRLSCAEVPQRTYARVLLPLVRLGRAPEAMKWHRKGYRPIAANPSFLPYLAQHLTFLVLTDNLTKAITLLERHLPAALESPSPSDRFDFLLAGRLLLDALGTQGKKALKLRLSASLPLHDAQGRYSTADLAAWVAAEVDELAGRFDARNRNDYFQRKIAGLEELKQWTTRCPLSARGGAR